MSFAVPFVSICMAFLYILVPCAGEVCQPALEFFMVLYADWKSLGVSACGDSGETMLSHC